MSVIYVYFCIPGVVLVSGQQDGGKFSSGFIVKMSDFYWHHWVYQNLHITPWTWNIGGQNVLLEKRFRIGKSLAKWERLEVLQFIHWFFFMRDCVLSLSPNLIYNFTPSTLCVCVLPVFSLWTKFSKNAGHESYPPSTCLGIQAFQICFMSPLKLLKMARSGSFLRNSAIS